MASVSILSDNGALSGSAGLKTSGGNDGVLLLQTTTSGGTPTTAISISNTQVVTYTNQPTYTGGTANGVLYLNGSKAVTSGTALVFDGTNLGVGTTSPSGRFHTAVADGATNAFYAERTGASAVQFSVNFANQFSNLASSSVMTFSTNGSERMRLDTSGNLGLGVTPSPWASNFKAIDINSSSGGGAVFSASNVPYAGIITNSYFGTGGGVYKKDGFAGYYLQDMQVGSGGKHIWAVAPSGTAGNAVTLTQAMTLDASGNLLLGSTTGSSNRRLSVVGGHMFNSTNNSHLYGNFNETSTSAIWEVRSNTGSSASIGFVEAGVAERWAIGTKASDASLVFASGATSVSVGTERARIDSSGNFLMTSAGTIYGSGLENCAFQADRGTLSATGYNYILCGTNNTGNKAVMFVNGSSRIADGGVNCLTFRNDGGPLILGSTSYVTSVLSSSDYRNKTNVIDYVGALNDVMAVQVRKYNYINSGDDRQYAGFFAHELQEVAPYAVINNKDAVREDGTPLYQGVDLQKIVPVLWCAIQELKAEIDVLKGQT